MSQGFDISFLLTLIFIDLPKDGATNGKNVVQTERLKRYISKKILEQASSSNNLVRS